MVIYYCARCMTPVGDFVPEDVAEEIRQDGDDPNKYGMCDDCGVTLVLGRSS